MNAATTIGYDAFAASLKHGSGPRRADSRHDDGWQARAMSAFPGTPRILKGGIVPLDPVTSAVLTARMIVLQYNPDTLSRSLQIQAIGADGRDYSEALRLKGPPVETIKLEAEIDATDQLEVPGQNRDHGRSRHLPPARAARNAGLSVRVRNCRRTIRGRVPASSKSFRWKRR